MHAVAPALFGAFLMAPGIALADSAPAPHCDTGLELTRLASPLPHVARKLAGGDPITIVAIGSSSTAGAGASSPDRAYPARLQVELTAQFPRHKITVLNRGVNGEEVNDMLRRFGTAIIAEKPDLVLWQLGTNSVIRDNVSISHDASIRDGINIIKRAGADIILIDPQFAPKVIVKPEAEHMVELISATAKAESVDLFQRFALMRRWHDVDHMTFEAIVSPDGLHMNDWSYGCLAKGLAESIVEAATRPVVSVSAAFFIP
jgi:acyl-CoA thioesterase-1